jgi:hypothetical protein
MPKFEIVRNGDDMAGAVRLVGDPADPVEGDHAVDVVLGEMGADIRDADPGTVVARVTFEDGMFVEWSHAESDTTPTSLAAFADGGRDLSSSGGGEGE